MLGISICMLLRIADFEIKPLNIDNPPDEIFTFADACKVQGVKNNESTQAMKFGRWGEEAWWCTWVDGKIVSISGCHKYDEYEKDCWRLMVRTATLKEYRSRAPGNFRQIKNDFNWGFILPEQIKYARSKGANKLIFTTNSDSAGDANSVRTNKTVSRVLEPQGLVKLLDTDVEIFYTKQNVWQILV